MNKNPERIARCEMLIVSMTERIEKLERLSVNRNELADKLEQIKTRFEQDEERFKMGAHIMAELKVAIEDLERRGLWRGMWRMARRMLRAVWRWLPTTTT